MRRHRARKSWWWWSASGLARRANAAWLSGGRGSGATRPPLPVVRKSTRSETRSGTKYSRSACSAMPISFLVADRRALVGGDLLEVVEDQADPLRALIGVVR